jgi:hypothetical protein
MNQENYYPGRDASPRRPGIVLWARRRTARRAVPTCQTDPRIEDLRLHFVQFGRKT